MLCVPTAFMKSALLPCADSASMGVLKTWLLGNSAQPAIIGDSPLACAAPACPLLAPALPFEVAPLWPLPAPAVPLFEPEAPLPAPAVPFAPESLAPPHALAMTSSDNTPAPRPNAVNRIS